MGQLWKARWFVRLVDRAQNHTPSRIQIAVDCDDRNYCKTRTTYPYRSPLAALPFRRLARTSGTYVTAV